MNILYLNNTQNMRFYIDGPLNLQITKKLRKFVFQKKFKKKIHPQPNKKKTFDRSDHILKRNMKFSNQKKGTKSRSRNGWNESWATKFNSYQFAIPLRRVVARFNDTLLEQLFPLVQPVNCEISFIWIAVLRSQVDTQTVYLSCIIHLHKYFCPAFVILLRLFNFFQSTRFKNIEK